MIFHILIRRDSSTSNSKKNQDILMAMAPVMMKTMNMPRIQMICSFKIKMEKKYRRK